MRGPQGQPSKVKSRVYCLVTAEKETDVGSLIWGPNRCWNTVISTGLVFDQRLWNHRGIQPQYEIHPARRLWKFRIFEDFRLRVVARWG